MSFDHLGVYGSGAGSDGGSQADPDANLGAYRSSTRAASLGIQGAMEGVTLGLLALGHEPGAAVLESDGVDRLRYTAPGSSTPGPWTTVSGSTLLVDGENASRGVVVTVPGTFPAAGRRNLLLVDQYNNALGFDHVDHAEREAGSDEYRAIFVKNNGASSAAVKVFLSPLGTSRQVDAGGYASSGTVTIGIGAGTFKDWPKSGFVENQDTGEVLYYSDRTDDELSVPASGRDVYGEVAGGAAGSEDDVLYPVSGLRVAKEAPSTQPSGFIQTIANETTAPTGVTFRHPISNADAQVVSFTLAAGEIQGLWLHRSVLADATAAAKVRNFVTIESTVAGDTFTYLLRGLFRMADNDLDRYELFQGVDADPDLAGAPWETFASLPHTTAGLATGHEYRFVLRKRNAYNLSSQNIKTWSVVVDGSGDPLDRPAAPEWTLAQASGAARFTAVYDYLRDAEDVRATHWAIWITDTGTPPDPDTDPADYEIPMTFSDGRAKLDYTEAAPHSHGASLKAIVRARREGTPDVDSDNADQQTLTADTMGPAAPVGSAFFGGAEEQR